MKTIAEELRELVRLSGEAALYRYQYGHAAANEMAAIVEARVQALVNRYESMVRLEDDLDAKDEEIARLQNALRAAQSPKTEVWVVWYFFCAVYGGDASVEGVFTTREAAKAYVDKDDSLIDSYRVERFELQDGEVETGG